MEGAQLNRGSFVMSLKEDITNSSSRIGRPFLQNKLANIDTPCNEYSMCSIGPSGSYNPHILTRGVITELQLTIVWKTIVADKQCCQLDSIENMSIDNTADK
ncbi:2388_t:CDS:1, partial [Scutellospora calospora]